MSPIDPVLAIRMALDRVRSLRRGVNLTACFMSFCCAVAAVLLGLTLGIHLAVERRVSAELYRECLEVQLVIAASIPARTTFLDCRR